MIERIDHIILEAPGFAEARRLLQQTGCPVTWDGSWESPTGAMRLFGVSVGPINIEVIDVAPHPERNSGVRSVAFDPGEIEVTVSELRDAGFNPDEPTEVNSMGHHFLDGVPAEARWRMAALHELLPGMSSFLCQYLAPQPHFGRTSADSPIRFVALEVAVPDPGAALKTYQRVLKVQPGAERNGYLLPLADTPIRLVEGDMVSLVLEARPSDLALRALPESFPAIRWVDTSGR